MFRFGALVIHYSLQFRNSIEMNPGEGEGTRKQFGNRFLSQNENVFKHNAWDNVEWDEEQEKRALESVQKNSVVTLTDDEVKKFEDDANLFWDAFYGIHQNNFFKDRHWLFTEFPELKADNDNAGAVSSSQMNIFEIGCGVGNTIFPILKYNDDPNLRVFGCDFSAKAIDILQKYEEFDEKRCRVFVLDATAERWTDTVPFEENSIDIIVLIFVLSAIHPDKMKNVIDNCFRYLKPGGTVLFRDYGRYDLAQLRIKAGKCLQDNFYVRGDGTRVYFFKQEELQSLFESSGFTQEANLIDRRLQVNRGKMLKMYRVWVQAKFGKPLENQDC